MPAIHDDLSIMLSCNYLKVQVAVVSLLFMTRPGPTPHRLRLLRRPTRSLRPQARAPSTTHRQAGRGRLPPCTNRGWIASSTSDNWRIGVVRDGACTNSRPRLTFFRLRCPRISAPLIRNSPNAESACCAKRFGNLPSGARGPGGPAYAPAEMPRCLPVRPHRDICMQQDFLL